MSWGVNQSSLFKWFLLLEFHEYWKILGLWSFKVVSRGQELQVLEILGHQNTFNEEFKIFGLNFSYLIFELVNFGGFWGPVEMRGFNFETK